MEVQGKRDDPEPGFLTDRMARRSRAGIVDTKEVPQYPGQEEGEHRVQVSQWREIWSRGVGLAKPIERDDAATDACGETRDESASTRSFLPSSGNVTELHAYYCCTCMWTLASN